jgi:hypothetical protein
MNALSDALDPDFRAESKKTFATLQMGGTGGAMVQAPILGAQALPCCISVFTA